MVMSKYVEHKISMNKIKYHSFEQYPLFRFSGYKVIKKDGKEFLTLTSNTPEFIQTSERLTSHDEFDKKYWILRTDFSDGLWDEDGNGIDDRDPYNDCGYTDLNHNAIVDGTLSPLFYQSTIQ